MAEGAEEEAPGSNLGRIGALGCERRWQLTASSAGGVASSLP